MEGFHFLRPYWLLAILPVIFVWWKFLRRQDERSRWAAVIDDHLLEHLLVGPNSRKQFRPVHALVLLLTISAVALAGPSFRLQPSPFIDDEAGLMILLKVTPTMNSEDVQPSRLARAKHKIKDLLELRSGSAAGLIAYSGSAHLVMPLTKDTGIINTMIEDLTPELMPKEGDALGSALKLAAQFIDKTGQPGSLLVIAGAVAPAQAAASGQRNTNPPVQFLSMLSVGSPVDPGMQQMSSALGASVTKLTVDSADVENIARRIKSSLASVSRNEQGRQWQDEGYWLLPVLAAFNLLWFRKGWVVR